MSIQHVDYAWHEFFPNGNFFFFFLKTLQLVVIDKIFSTRCSSKQLLCSWCTLGSRTYGLYVIYLGYVYIYWFFTCSDISVYHVIFNTGLFHGHSNLVCNLLNFVWWHCWSLWSSRRGLHLFYLILY